MTHLEIAAFFDLNDFEHKDLFSNCDHPWEALRNIDAYIETFFQNQAPCASYPGVTLIRPELIFVGEGTVIEQGAYIEGPCILGKNCTVRHAAYLRKNVIAGDGCVIGHSVELKNVILLNRAHIAHLSYVGDSIFGNACNLGAGVKCANVKFDRSPITISTDAKDYETGFRKLGAIIGDRVQLGCNSVTNPGTLIGKDSYLFPCTNFGGVAPAESSIRLPQKAIIRPKKSKEMVE